MAKKVLVVDDDPLVRNLIATLLRRKGFVAIQAANGDEAIALLTQAQQILPDSHDFDLVLLDLMMSRTNGWEVLKFIEKELPKLIRHVVVVSASGDVGTREASRIGCGAVLPKPFDNEDLYRVVTKCMRGTTVIDPDETLPIVTLVIYGLAQL